MVGRHGVLVHNDCFLATLSKDAKFDGLIQKLDQLDDNLKAAFIRDFQNAGEEVLNTLAREEGKLVEDYKLLFSSKPELRKDINSLLSFNKLRNNSYLNEIGISVQDLSLMKSGKNDSFRELMTDLDALFTKLSNNPNTQIPNLKTKLIDKFLESGTDLVTLNKRQGAHGVVKALNDSFDELIIDGNVTLEAQVANSRQKAPSYEDIHVEIEVVSGENLTTRIEVKYCNNCVDQNTIISQFVERDLYNASSLNEIRWRIYGQNFTKEDLIRILSSDQGKIALKPLYDNGKLKQLAPKYTIDTIDDFIEIFRKDEIFKTIFN